MIERSLEINIAVIFAKLNKLWAQYNFVRVDFSS